MEEKFSNWLVKAEGKIEATGRNYSRAIHRISEHYRSHTGIAINIYEIEIGELNKIKNHYDTTGKFAEFGHKSHGLYRAAIKALYRYKHSLPVTRKKKNTKPYSHINSTKRKKKNKNRFFLRKTYEFFLKLFQRKPSKKIVTGDFQGTKGQIVKYLKPLSNKWEHEVHEKYLIDNPQCQRCRSAEFPEVFEMPFLSSNKVLKTILQDLPGRGKHSISISNIESRFKSQIAYGDRLIVLCRTCRKKQDKSKLERYPHEMPAIMRRGPSELKY